MKKKVVVGMSGGVDSSVTAAILKDRGYDVTGITMEIWQKDLRESDGGCCSLSAVEDARRVADRLGIPHYVLNFRDDFKKNVIDSFAAEYFRGRTPNPCILCNRYVKWESLLEKAAQLGADYLATGHYASVVRMPEGRYSIGVSKGARKDQSYALYSLTQDQLSRTLMPLGDYEKDEVRAMAGELGLAVASKPDSQEICFVPDNDYGAFLREYAKKEGLEVPGEGDFVLDGEVVGRHRGIFCYTIGQRRGLSLPMGERVYVTAIRADTDSVLLGDNDSLFSHSLRCRSLNFMGMSPDSMTVADSRTAEELGEAYLAEGRSVCEDERVCYTGSCRIRYNHGGSPCIAVRTGADELTVFFREPVRAVTPGQAAVLYSDGVIMAGGVIE